MQRIMGRDGIREDYARARIESQQPDAFYKEHCDILIENTGTPEEFSRKCEMIFMEVLQHGKQNN